MTRLQDDFYKAINGAWEETAIIPEDKPLTGGFMDLDLAIEAWLLETTNQWLADQHLPDDPILRHYMTYHKQLADFETRESLGVSPAMPLVNEMRSFDSFKAFTASIARLEKEAKPNLLPLGVAPDFMDATTHVLWADAPGLILPDTTYYTDDTEKGQELLGIWRQMQEELMARFGYEPAAITDILDKVIALDAELAAYVLSSEESSQYAQLYHPYDWQDFIALAPELPLDSIMSDILGQSPDKVIVPEERFWTDYAARYFSQGNWPRLSAVLQLEAVNEWTSYLTEDIRILSGKYGRAVSGVPEPQAKEKAAMKAAQAPFSQAIGLRYVADHFSPSAKKDVEDKVAKMIAVYQKRLEAADWLAKETREKAITKLTHITAHIGYPDQLPAIYAKKIVDPKKSLIENATALAEVSIADSWRKWNQPVDKTEWHMPAHMVNAYYDPQQNQIVFPAAILQAPFYSLEQSSSANYGGIGAVIAHEISHAFDSNGASFDEHGSLNNWWQEADYEAFTQKTQAVIDQFDGRDSYGAKVNGKLTVSENIADLGGLAASLTAAQAESDFDVKAYFENFARIWRMKARQAYMQVMASVDVHAPGKLRVNVQLPNFALFHETYGIRPGDGMWRDEKDRVMIW